jgi:riboflavin kinase/FMN adenylyltransferase
MTPDQFVAEVLKERLALAGAVVGRDFRFGKGRAGDAAALRDLSAAHGLFALIVEPTPADGGGKIGSTAIREAIAAGQMERAADLLGRRWRVEGRVEEGSRLGRTIGFPTANLRLGDIIEPRRGVYAVWARRRGRRLSGVANFGRRPTVGSAATLLEVHLFDQAGDFYGERIDVEFVGFIRDEVKFPDLDALKRQIAADCETARKILAASA